MSADSDRNVEIVRRGFGAFETMDMDAFTAEVYTGHKRAKQAAKT
jgi:ketosteroid isomerase-like protein